MKTPKAFILAATLLVCVCCQSFTTLQAQTNVTFETNLGNIEVELFDDTAPLSVANFLGYVSRGDYVETIFHRSVLVTNPPFGDPFGIIQGGGFRRDFSAIDTQPPVPNEFSASNVTGTLAYARTSDPDSATSQFFFNTLDNSNNLDNQTGGFTVFGQITAGLDIAQAINQLDTVDEGGAFSDLPVLDEDAVIANNNDVGPDDVVVLQRIFVVSAIPEPTAVAVIAFGSLIGLTQRRKRLLA